MLKHALYKETDVVVEKLFSQPCIYLSIEEESSVDLDSNSTEQYAVLAWYNLIVGQHLSCSSYTRRMVSSLHKIWTRTNGLLTDRGWKS
jgi:hypothetical protein